MKKIIYRISDNPNWGYMKGSNAWYQVREQLDAKEHYLFREVWRLNEYELCNVYQEKIEDDYIKIIDDNWIKKHTIGKNGIEFYGCEVLKDFESYEDYESCIPTQYDREINNL